MSPPMYAAAQRYTAAGLSVVPVRLTDKLPAAALLPKNGAGRRVWAPFQVHIPSDDWLRQWFAATDAGMALVCGRVSGGLEVLDFDHHPPEQPQVCAAWAELVESQAPGLVARLIIARTQHDGRHVAYRCAEIAGNQKLAQYPTTELATGKPQRMTLIETRGEGGYFLVEPSAGYTVLQGDLTAIPTITPAARAILLATARSFNTATATITAPAHARSGPAPTTAPAAGGLRPGDDYNARTTLAETATLLARHGWTQVHQRGAVSYWRRPGKPGGWSATLGHLLGKFFVFSGSLGFCGKGPHIGVHLTQTGDTLPDPGTAAERAL
ncbi:MAG: bifunctional DNA primase/polymerase [Chloroflexi bacterium]|nr:bifunctional DNA primase/polymerase [Chloroflexota bacterium]